MAVRRPAQPRVQAAKERKAAPPRGAVAPGPVVAEPVAQEPVAQKPVAQEIPAPPSPLPHATGTPMRRGPGRRAVVGAGIALGAGAAVVGAGAIALPQLLAEQEPAPQASDAARGDRAAGQALRDVAEDDPRAEAIRWAAGAGILPARADGTFGPDEPVERGALALALHAFAGSPQLDLASAPALFADLPERPDEARAALWLHGRAALWGDDRLRFRPRDRATRDEAASILGALLEPGMRALGALRDPAAAQGQFPDLRDGDPAASDVRWLLGAGVLEGAGRWDGGAPVLRGDLAAVLHRAHGVIAGIVG